MVLFMETDIGTATVNGRTAKFGCYIDGHWGQYGIDRLPYVAELFGIDVSERPADFRVLADNAESGPEIDHYWDAYHAVAQDIEYALNAATQGGLWSWIDGEFYLSSWEDDGIW